MIIAVDFDGTATTHEFPKVGKEIGAVPVLKELVKQGHQLILWTMRSDTKSLDENYLTDAVNWFQKHEIPLYGVQRNPTQDTWTTSPKCYAQLYIDDAALGCPLTSDGTQTNRPFVDWYEIYDYLLAQGILRNTTDEQYEITDEISKQLNDSALLL